MNPRQHTIRLGEPAEKEIQNAAYFLWEEAGRPVGRDQEFWFTARERLRHTAPVKVTVRNLPRPAVSSARNAQPADAVIC
jgi:hypothetical protein